MTWSSRLHRRIALARKESETTEMPQSADTPAVVMERPAAESSESLAERVESAVDRAVRARRTYETFVRVSLFACIPLVGLLALFQRQVEVAILLAIFVAVVVGGIGLVMLQAYERAADRLSAVEEVP